MSVSVRACCCREGCRGRAARGRILVKDPDGCREEVPRRAALLLLTHSSLLPWQGALHLLHNVSCCTTLAAFVLCM